MAMSTAEEPMERALRNGATVIPASVCEALYGGRPSEWPTFYDRDAEPWAASPESHDGDTVMFPFACNMRPMLRRDVQAEFGPLVTEELYDEYTDAMNGRLAREHAARTEEPA